MPPSAVEFLDNARDHRASPLRGTDDASLAGAGPARAAATLIPVLILVLTADIGLVNLDDAHELLKFLILKRGADAVAHVPSRLVRAESLIRIAEIVNNRRRITADTTVRLGLYFGNTPEFWMNLQTHYDLKMAKRNLNPEDAKRIRSRRAA